MSEILGTMWYLLAAYLVRLIFSFYFSIKFFICCLYVCLLFWYSPICHITGNCLRDLINIHSNIIMQFPSNLDAEKDVIPLYPLIPIHDEIYQFAGSLSHKRRKKIEIPCNTFTLKSSRTLVSIWESVIVENSIFPFYGGNVFGWMNIIIISLLQIIFVFTILTIIRFLYSSWFSCWKVDPNWNPTL